MVGKLDSRNTQIILNIVFLVVLSILVTVLNIFGISAGFNLNKSDTLVTLISSKNVKLKILM